MTVIKKIYPTSIERRNNWVKFGLAMDKDNHLITTISNKDVRMHYMDDDDFDCICGYIHWNLPCYADIDGKIIKFGYKRDNEIEITKELIQSDKESNKVYNKKEHKKEHKNEKTFTISIKNINYDEINEYDILKLASPYGNIKNISIGRGISFVSYSNIESVYNAIEHLDNKGFNHQFLKVQKCFN